MVTAFALCLWISVLAHSAQSAQVPHPAIVRIISPERDGASYGSGSFVAANDTYGLVLTNWHVVRDAVAPIWVAFPDGFRSAATVLKVDRDWDLAALAIWHPNVTPLPLATQAPQLGEWLTIAGYGSGSFRAISGPCTQYVSPGGNNPFEMIELAASARNGDSGGPILNNRGEVAGVLFGSASGQTTGSYCGRVRWFLSSVADDFQRLPVQQNTIAQQQSPALVPVPTAAIAAQPSEPVASVYKPPNPQQHQIVPPQVVDNRVASSVTTTINSKPVNGPPPTVSMLENYSPFDQVRNFMAVIGCIAILIHGLRIVSKFAG